MVKRLFETESVIGAPAEAVFEWHERDDALEKLIPPGDPVEVVNRSGGIEEGATVTLKVGFGPFSIEWHARHREYVEGRRFVDVQEHGPFAHWVHTHETEPIDETTSRLRDHVEYELPFGRIGDLLGHWLVRRKLQSMFEHRHRVTKQELEDQAST